MNCQRRTAGQLRRFGVVLAAVVVVLVSVFGVTASAATQTTGAKAGAEVAAPNEVASSPIAVGGSHACALPGDSTVKCWGSLNWYGELGDGTKWDPTTPGDIGDNVLPPVTVIAEAGSTAPLSGVTAIAAGLRHTCAVLTTGTVKCWGKNSSIEDDPFALSGSGGQLGDGTTIDRLAPVTVHRRGRQHGAPVGCHCHRRGVVQYLRPLGRWHRQVLGRRSLLRRAW